jgi:hypothetical protein
MPTMAMVASRVVRAVRSASWTFSDGWASRGLVGGEREREREEKIQGVIW